MTLFRAPNPARVIPTGAARPFLARGVGAPRCAVEEPLFDLRNIAD